MFPGFYSISEQTSYSENSTTTNGFKKNLTKTCGQGNVRSGKCPVGEMSNRGSVRQESISCCCCCCLIYLKSVKYTIAQIYLQFNI